MSSVNHHQPSKGKEKKPPNTFESAVVASCNYLQLLLARPLIASTCRPSSSPEQHRTMFLSWAAVREGTTAEWGYTRVGRLQQNLVSLGFQRVSKDRITAVNRIMFFISKEKKHAHRNFRKTFNIKLNTLTASQQQDTGSTTEHRRNPQCHANSRRLTGRLKTLTSLSSQNQSHTHFLSGYFKIKSLCLRDEAMLFLVYLL